MFLAVPLLSASHAWLSILAARSKRPEMKEDALFMAKILEGRWLMEEISAYGLLYDVDTIPEEPTQEGSEWS